MANTCDSTCFTGGRTMAPLPAASSPKGREAAVAAAPEGGAPGAPRGRFFGRFRSRAAFSGIAGCTPSMASQCGSSPTSMGGRGSAFPITCSVPRGNPSVERSRLQRGLQCGERGADSHLRHRCARFHAPS